MENRTVRASKNNQKVEIVLSDNGGTLPPLVQPATEAEEIAYSRAGVAVARGDFEEAKNILREAGFTIQE
jgi:hypothetical protein